MDRTVLLNRIRHLLNKTVANGATEAEAATALRAAERLMADHDLSMAEAMEAGERVEFAFETARGFGARTPAFLPDVNRVVEKVFGVEVLVRSSRLSHSDRLVNVRAVIFGEASKIEAACWGFGFLCDTFRRLWTEYRIRNRDKVGFHASLAGGYYAGLADGFLAKIQVLGPKPTTNALVRLDAAMQQAFAEAFPGVQRAIVTSRCDASVYASGFQDGATINLARPVEQGGRPQLEG